MGRANINAAGGFLRALQEPRAGGQSVDPLPAKDVLRLLVAQPLPPSALADRLNLNEDAIVRTVRSLQDLSLVLVRVGADEDLIELTERGREVTGTT